MKKRILFVLFLIIVLFISFGIYIKMNQNKQNKEKENNQRNTLIVVNLYYNNAWTKMCSGSAIFSDGSIYTWNLKGEQVNFDSNQLNNRTEMENYTLKNAQKEENIVSKEDLKKLKEYINKLPSEEEAIILTCIGNDMGSGYFIAWKDDKTNILSINGDCYGSLENQYAEKIENVSNEYFSKNLDNK